MKNSKKNILKYTGLSNEVFELFRFELNMLLLRTGNFLNPIKRKKIEKISNADSILLNVGAGPFGEEGWVNIDMFHYKKISFTYDCRKKIPLKDSTVSIIRCEHVLEHMDKEYEAISFLKESLRVLKPGGIIRIVVPDIEKFIEAYYKKDWKIVGIELEHVSNWGEAEILTHIFRQGGEHKFGYDYNALSRLLKFAGFTQIQREEYRISKDVRLENDQENHRYHSLYVEAIKE